MTARSDEILTRVDNGVGILTLNRPKAINSLTHTMVNAHDRGAHGVGSTTTPSRAVVLTGAGERGLCAGGDTGRDLPQRPRRRRRRPQFWFDEYLPQRADRPIPQAVRRR